MTHNPKKVLVLMPCSSSKIETAQPVPMFRLYDGPLWQTLRAYRGAIPWENVCVLSGGEGFCCAWSRVPTYNARLSEELADRFIEAGIYARDRVFAGPSPWVTMGAGRRIYSLVINAGSGHYKRVFDAFIHELGAEGALAPDARIVSVAGGIGEQRSQLGEILREANVGACQFDEELAVSNPRAVDERTIAERKWRSPLKPGADQKPCDEGLFSDEKNQLPLL